MNIEKIKETAASALILLSGLQEMLEAEGYNLSEATAQLVVTDQSDNRLEGEGLNLKVLINNTLHDLEAITKIAANCEKSEKDFAEYMIEQCAIDSNDTQSEFDFSIAGLKQIWDAAIAYAYSSNEGDA